MKIRDQDILSIFPTPITITNIGRDFTKDELQLLLFDVSFSEVPKDFVISNHQSENLYLFDGFEKELKDIKDFCTDQIKNYLEEIKGVDTDIAGLRITQSWLNKTKPNENHHFHVHPNSFLSGVLYICCLQNDNIDFENRIHGMFDNMEFPTKKFNSWNTKSTSVRVTEGDLILFPSWIPHGVSPNETKDRERISLAFNTFPIGEMGEEGRGNHVKL